MMRIEGINEGIIIWYNSSDTLPVTSKVPHGTIAICVEDTTKCYIFDKENMRWLPVR